MTPEPESFYFGRVFFTRTVPSSVENATLLLPVADAAGLARPGLDARVLGLRIERIAAPVRKMRTRRSLRRQARSLCQAVRHRDPLSGDGLRFRLQLLARPFRLAGAIGPRLDRHLLERSRRTKRLWRQHRLRQVEAEILLGAVLGRHRRARTKQSGGEKS